MNTAHKVGLKILRKLHAARKLPRKRRAARAFADIELRSGDLAIDCGANVGDITASLAARGATVCAFEPNPLAFERLQGRFAGNDRVECRQQAVVTEGSSARLYLHRRYADDPLGHSAGSSLVAAKHNLDAGRFIDVEAVVLSEFIAGLDARVRVLKIDVEGLEVALLESLLDSGAIDLVDHVFCETHELKVPGLLGEVRTLRRRLAAAGIDHVNLDWA